VLVAAAVCPHPPLLVPEAMGAAGLRPGSEMEAVRSACDAAVAGLAGARPDLLAVVGGAAASGTYDQMAAGSLSEYGIGCTVGDGPPVLPLSLTVAVWLLGRAALSPSRPSIRLHAVARHTPVAQCLRLGAEIAAQAPRVAMLAMGDGTARKAAGVPGAADPAADSYDADAAAALMAADPARLARLAPSLDSELMVSGRAAGQVLAGAAGAARYQGRLRYAAQPFAVSYLVASWEIGG
jgi:hypothetical protein